MSTVVAATGWYSDPLGRYPWRYWTGTAWSQWVYTGSTVFEDQLPVGSVDDELAHIAFAEQAIGDLHARHLVNQRVWMVVLADLRRRRQVVTAGGALRPPDWIRPRAEWPAPARPAKRPAPAVPHPAAARHEARPVTEPPLPERYLSKAPPRDVPREARQPRVVPVLRAAWRRVRRALVSDLALYGLAYLGVLLLFTGVFGLVAFSMAEVRRDLRPAAEAAVPIATFASAWLLGRHGRQLVPKTLVLLGGLLLPVVLLASFVDGAPIPPDPRGAGLVASLTTASLVVATLYAVVARRWRESPIRFLVAPAVWLAVAMAGLGAHPTIPHAEGITKPVPWQMAVVAVAIAATVFGARLLPALWRRSVEWSAVPAVAVTLLLTAVASSANDWPAPPLVVAGAATAVTVELLAHLVKPQVVAVSQVLLAAAVLVACTPEWGLSWVGVAGVVSFVGIAEWEGWRRPSLVATAASLGGAAVWLGVASWRTWPAVSAYGAVSVWAHVRRYRRAAWLPGPPWMAAVAAVVPAGVVGALMAELPAGRVTVGTACAVGAISSGVLWTGRDAFWRWWVAGAAAIDVALALGNGVSYAGLAVITGLSVLAFAAAPVWSWLRSWVIAASAAASSAYALAAVSAPSTTRVVVFALAGLAVVAGGSLRVLARGGHVGLIGHAVSAGALAATAYPAARAAFFPALAGFTAGWLLTTTADEISGAPVVELVRSAARDGVPEIPWLQRAVSALPRVMTMLSLPVLAVTAADRWGLVGVRDSGSALVVTALAFVYVVAGRWLLADRLGGLLAPAGFGFTVLAVLGSRSEAVAAIAVGAAIATVAVMDPALRREPYGWCAWALTAPLVVLVARQLGVVGSRWYPALIVWGAVLEVSVLAWDDALNGRRNREEWIRTPWMAAPGLLAIAMLVVGTAAEFTSPPDSYGWWSLAVGAVTAVVAWQLRDGFISLLTWVLLTVGYVSLAPWDPITRPWSLALEGLVLAGLAVLLQATEPASGRWWQSWHWSALSAALGIVVIALGATSRYDSVAATFCVAGGLAVGMWAWRREVPWLYVASPLFVAASSDTNQGWAALVLFAIAAESTLLAVRAQRVERALLQLVSAATFAAGAVLLGVWFGASADQASISAGLAAAVVLACAGVAVRRARAALEWAAPWAALAVLALAGTAGAVFGGSVGRAGPGEAVAAGFVGASIGLGLAARPLLWPALRDGAALTFATACSAVLYSASPPAWISVVAGTGLGLAAASAASISHAVFGQGPWIRPLIVLAAVSTAGAAGVSSFAGPGPGSASLVLAAVSVELLLAALAVRGWARLVLEMSAAAALAGALVELGLWLQLSRDQAVITAALAGGAVIASAGSAVRWTRLTAGWAVAWAPTAFVALALAAGACFAGTVSHQGPGLAVAGGFGLAAAGAGLAAGPLRQWWLRDSSAVFATVSGAALLFALRPTSGQLVAATTGTGLAATLLTAVLQRIRPGTAWIRPLVVFGSSATAGALGVAGYELPRRDLLALALLAAGTQTAVVGFVFRQLGALLVSPVVLCASWFTFATESLSGNPQWYTIPFGLTLVAIDELERDHFRRIGQHPAPPVVALEYVAMAFIVGSALGQEIVTSLVYGILAVGLGAALALWGVVTHVRRRLFFGTGTATASVLLLIALPTAASAPGWHGPSLWVAVALLGVAAMAIAAGIEQGHARLHHMVVHLGQMLRNWE